jgi:hypothetical protein
MKIENVSKRIHNKFMQVKQYRLNSEPYLSGDLFADNADVSLYNPLFRKFQPSKKSISEAKVIFCPSDYLERFIDDYYSETTAKVLILGNSDRDFSHFEFKLPPSIRRVFLQNSLLIDRRFTVLPIGIENLRINNNGLPNYFGHTFLNVDKKVKILSGPFARTHHEREFLLSKPTLTYPWVDTITKRISPAEYAVVSSEYKYIACPRGNGIDTHRFWESLYRGSIPVVKSSQWVHNIGKLGIPLIEIEDWDEKSIQETLRVMNGTKIEPKKIKPLWWPYWKDQIGREL